LDVRAIAIVISLASPFCRLLGRGESKHFKSDAIGNEEQRVFTLEQQWADAEVKHDATALARTLDDEFVVSYSSGKPMDKAAFIAQVMAFSMAEILSYDWLRTSRQVDGTAVILSFLG
jgi:hypothetical protein